MVKQVRKFAHTPAVRALLILVGGVVAVAGGIALSPVMDFSPPVIARTAGCEDPSCDALTKNLCPTQMFKGSKWLTQGCQPPKPGEQKAKDGVIGLPCVEKDNTVGGAKGKCSAHCKCKGETTLDGKPLMKPMMMPMMKDMMMGMPMPPMLPMPMPKMGMMMPMMPMDMMPTGGCDSVYARYFPSEECQKQLGQTEQSPVSSFLEQSWDRLGNLFGNDATDDAEATKNQGVQTTVDANNTTVIQPKGTTVTNTNNGNANTNLPVTNTTFPNTNTTPDITAQQQQAQTILQQVKNLLNQWLTWL